jgi:hypothetical protein
MKTLIPTNVCATKIQKKLISRSYLTESTPMKTNAKLASSVCVALLIVLLAFPTTLSLLTASVTLSSSGVISTLAILPLHTDGTYIKDSSNGTVYLRGVNYPSGFTASCSGCFPANGDWLWGACFTSLSQSSLNARLAEMQSYGFNTIRLIFNPSWWQSNSATNLNGQTTTIHIREAMLQVIQSAQNYGIYCIVAPWTSDQVPANQFSSATAFANFWTSVVQVLGAEPNALFDLWNEPNTNPSESVWCSTWAPAACAAIRAYSQNLIFIQYGWCGGFGFASSVWSSCGQYGNIVMSNHIYRYPAGSTFSGSSGTTTSVCDSTLRNSWSYGTVIGHYPMYIGEIGAYTAQSGDTAWFTSCLSVLNSYGASYTAWEWGQDGTNWQLSTPTTAPWSPNTNGQVLRNAIASGS